MRDRRLRHDGERGVDLRQAQTRLRLRWRRDGRNLKLLVSQAGCVESLPKKKKKEVEKKSWDEINKQINTSIKKKIQAPQNQNLQSAGRALSDTLEGNLWGLKTTTLFMGASVWVES